MTKQQTEKKKDLPTAVYVVAIFSILAAIWLGETEPTRDIPILARQYGPITNWFFCLFTLSLALVIFLARTYETEKVEVTGKGVAVAAGAAVILLLFGFEGLFGLVLLSFLLNPKLRQKGGKSSNPPLKGGEDGSGF